MAAFAGMSAFLSASSHAVYPSSHSLIREPRITISCTQAAMCCCCFEGLSLVIKIFVIWPTNSSYSCITEQIAVPLFFYCISSAK